MASPRPTAARSWLRLRRSDGGGDGAQPTGVVELTRREASRAARPDDGVLLVVDDTIWVDNQQNSADEPTDANKENADALTAVAGDDGQPMQLWGSVHLSTTRGGAVLAAHEGGNAIYRLLSPDVRRKVAKEAARTSDEFSRVVDALALDCAQLEEQVAAADADLDAAHADAAAALTALHRITYGAECDALVSEARTEGGAAAPPALPLWSPTVVCTMLRNAPTLDELPRLLGAATLPAEHVASAKYALTDYLRSYRWPADAPSARSNVEAILALARAADGFVDEDVVAAVIGRRIPAADLGATMALVACARRVEAAAAGPATAGDGDALEGWPSSGRSTTRRRVGSRG